MSARWTKDKANEWSKTKPWFTGCNFIPSNAINQLEMWQEDTFDGAAINRELGWASGLGFNIMRVYLHDLVWENDKDGFKKRIDEYLRIASKNKIFTLFVIFDDCWLANPKTGKQPEPVPGIHNSGWLQSPGIDVVNDSSKWGRLERYVKDILKVFGSDERVVIWDLYNEPGNSKQETKSLPLLKKVFEWAREAGPSQPVSAGVWSVNKELNEFQLGESDIITFHNYMDAANFQSQIIELKKLGRPLICTEYMARPNSTFKSCLPVFKKENVGCINWGLVSGKTQTIFKWGSKGGNTEPPVWFHDIFRKDGTPYDKKETDFIRDMLKGRNI